MRLRGTSKEHTTFIDAHLSNLNLIQISDINTCELTVTGRAFLESVSDPSME